MNSSEKPISFRDQIIQEDREAEFEEQHGKSYSAGYRDGWRDGRLDLNNPLFAKLEDGLKHLREECEGYEDGSPDCGPKAKLANSLLPTIRSLLAVVRSNRPAPKPEVGHE